MTSNFELLIRDQEIIAKTMEILFEKWYSFK